MVGLGNIKGIEGKILKKYKSGKVIDDKERIYVERMQNTGLMRGSELIAKTTLLGRISIL